jgi:hypothetical protein
VISHRHRCIFVHQRKSAGTSVKAMFPDVAEADRGRFNEGVLAPWWDPSDPTIRDYFKFTVIRNPWDRFVSGWRHCASTRRRPILDVLGNLPRQRLVDNLLDPRASGLARLHYGREILRQSKDRLKFALRRAVGADDRPPQRPGHDYRHVTRPQRATSVYPDGRLAMDRVVFFEDLEAGLREVCAAIGKPYAPPPALRVRRRDDDYRRHFDDRARAAFAEAFADDLAYWGYDFATGLPTWPRDG